ncbi:hypothetical protein SAY86_019589 [Trapa natans]|uniref:RING-type E3 ubiquitin transferase n=1 Tax=Trapa natans TaxID=22666 RepID=A0AAN7R4U9_TRANT|nr:hypothetical protein SAY86_019589 [Trapa natans]
MRNHSPPINHVATCSKGAPTIIFLLLLLVHTAAAQNDTAAEPPDLPPQVPYAQKFNPTMAIIMVVLVSAFFLMGFFSVYVRQCADGRPRGRQWDPSEGAFLFRRRSLRGALTGDGIDASVIRSFPTFEYSSVKGLKIGKISLECAVCLNEFEEDDVLRLLPRCNHVFHPDCIDAWLSSHVTCPVCRAKAAPKPDEKFDLPVIPTSEREPEPGVGTGGGLPDQVCIRVDDGLNIESKSQYSQADGGSFTVNGNRPPRSRSTGMRFARLFPFQRSHSTGHPPAQLGEDHERFTLRLPEDVRDQIIKTADLDRTERRNTAFPRVRSESSGYRLTGSVDGGSNTRGKSFFNCEGSGQEDLTGRWGFSLTPPSIGSVRSASGGGDAGVIPPSSTSGSEKLPPFDGLLIGQGLNGEDGEKSLSNPARPRG